MSLATRLFDQVEILDDYPSQSRRLSRLPQRRKNAAQMHCRRKGTRRRACVAMRHCRVVTGEVEQDMQALRVLRNYNGSRSVMSTSFLFMFLYRQTESEVEVSLSLSLSLFSLSLSVALSEDGNSLAVSPFFHAGCEKKVQARTDRRHLRTKGCLSRLARGARTEQREPRGQHCIANAKNSALSM